MADYFFQHLFFYWKVSKKLYNIWRCYWYMFWSI